MAKKKKEKVEQTTNEPKGDVTKVEAKMKKPAEVIEDTITKVDLSNPPKIEEDEQSVDTTKTEDVQEKVIEETIDKKEDVEQSTEENVEQSIIEEITDEEKIENVTEKVEEAITQSVESGEPLPENIQNLVNFMQETGGDLNDYVKLNKDYSKMDNQTLLQEHYKQTKPHLSSEEIDFLMEDQFSYDEDIDDEKDIKRKKLALKEQVANAKTQLEENKSKYYQEIKSGSKLTSEQQEAISFYDSYTKESGEVEKQQKAAKADFLNKTNRFFGDQFKGFEYNVGEKRFRFNINDASKVMETQSDIGNFIGKFLDKNENIKDEAGYHKSLYTAMNADAVANHFYEQGKADALKESVAKSKNINMTPRQELGENTNIDGVKVKVLGDNTPDFKFKIKQK
jgi:hypothetical protein